jgi:two-component system, chemotaxis family, sensor kinase CheA
MSQAIAAPGDPAERAGQPVAEPQATSAGQRTSSATAHASPVALTGETDTVRMAVSSLDARLLEAEEMLAAKLAAEQRATDLGALVSGFTQWRKEWARVQPRTRMLRRSMERPGDTGKVAALRRTAGQDCLLVGKLVDDLLENSKKLLMLPLATLSGLLSKLVRDLSRDQGKEAELTIRGGEVTIDKRILEELKDPLIHVLRNCVDHGVETPDQRRSAGKTPRATITLAVAALNGNQVEISVSDDGAGIDIGKVKQAADRRGLVAPNTFDQLTKSAALAVVFESNLSTSPMITQVSGRGLGLAIVREKAEKLGGRVAIESRRGSVKTAKS